MSNNNPKTITKPLLRQLNDHSGGGFLLFNFDENGMPEMHSNFDTHAEAMALQYYCQNWLKAVELVTVEQMSLNIAQGQEPSREEGDDLDEI